MRELLPEIPLEMSGRLPLGQRGAALFGEGWGPPESSPRLRRLMPGTVMLYVPWNAAQALLVSLELQTPHVAGELSLGSQRIDVEPEQKRVTIGLPAGRTRRGLNRLDLFWQGREPLQVTPSG